jgi:hypothetical protein
MGRGESEGGRCQGRVVAALLLVHTGLLAWSAYRHSPVMPEVGHLPAGISHWTLGRFDLYRVNPPLVRMVAAIPMAIAGPECNWESYSTDPTVRSESYVGRDFVDANRGRSFWLYTLGRWACIPFSLIGAYVCFLWASRLYGPRSGVVAMLLWCLCPNVIGNASLLMPDAPAAALAAAAGLVYWSWLRCPTWQGALVSGIVLGLAELTKTTLLILPAIWPLLWVVYVACAGRPGRSVGPLGEVAMLILQLATAVLVINAGYAFEGSFERLGTFHFQSRSLTGSPGAGGPAVGRNRFVGSWLGEVPVPLPSNYVQGIDSQKVDFERGMPSYLGGRWSERGQWYYYLYAMGVKLPAGTLLLLLASVIASIPARGRAHSARDELVLLLPALAILLLVSSQTGLAIHFRYILPALPFLFIFASKVFCGPGAGQSGVDGANGVRGGPARAPGPALLRRAGAVALTWSLASSLWAYPHCISYFNEFAGGPDDGADHLLDSCIAWGQDLLYLKAWWGANPGARPLHVASMGPVNPAYAGIESRPPPLGPSKVGRVAGVHTAALGPVPGWFAIDKNFVYGSRSGLSYTGQAATHRRGLSLEYFRRFRPAGAVGGSFLIFKISPEDANRARREMGMAELPPPAAPASSGMMAPDPEGGGMMAQLLGHWQGPPDSAGITENERSRGSPRAGSGRDSSRSGPPAGRRQVRVVVPRSAGLSRR